MMQAVGASRCLPKLGWEVNTAVRANASSVRASTSGLRTAVQHRASSVATSTPAPRHGPGGAVRQLTTGSRTTQLHPSMSRICWRASASARFSYVLRHDTYLCRNSSSNSSSRGGSLTATTEVAALPRGGSIGRGSREATEPSAAAEAAVAARRGMSSSAMSERDFHLIADEALEDIHDAVEEALEDGFAGEFDCNMSQGVLNIVVGDRGTWVLNKQSPNRQIWWSSPISGPMRFEYHNDSKRWLNTRNGKTELRDLLAKEMAEKCGVSLC